MKKANIEQLEKELYTIRVAIRSESDESELTRLIIRRDEINAIISQNKKPIEYSRESMLDAYFS